MSHIKIETQQLVGSLYRQHQSWLHQWLRRRLGDHHRALDLAHDTFVRILSRPAILENVREPRALLSTIAGGLLVDHWRRQDLERAWLEAWAQQPEAEHPSPEHMAMLLQALDAIDAMLASLGKRCRDAFILHQIHGMTHKEIAAQLGVSDRMVRKYLSQAMLHCLLATQDQALEGVTAPPAGASP